MPGWIPDTSRLRDTRWRLSGKHVLVLVAILTIGLAWAGCSMLRSRPEPIPDARPSTTLTTGTPVTTPTTTPRPTTALVVHVAGKVHRPGLIRAQSGARVADVLTLAGGPLRGVDLSALNLARQVTDGEQIIVGQPPTSAAPPDNPTPTPAGPISLNTATAPQLDALPGVGPVLAQRILDYRTQNGPFTTVDQLQEVPGVGPKKFDSLKPHVRL
ncbi:ComEA family DNA-binding protein [Kribbella sandramycini]|uniref:ComEA family DNA-binding protein n=1 Tax=Kribbella sandramycini TaxID=60450 RepID=A0A7Y4NX06_9ACTN|nr:ComEA family DNA-binding protein [Kribbella sandramycini]MBB6568029.1 competence protein ComEA [Kribbella sandramycini]NOL39377.1 ComEA family DNA-binding protein [Kribbella sandramycini]